jgi:hypothetical protein
VQLHNGVKVIGLLYELKKNCPSCYNQYLRGEISEINKACEILFESTSKITVSNKPPWFHTT